MANNTIKVKRTSVSGRTPNTTNSGNAQYIGAGEFGLNMTDRILYSSDGTNLIEVGANNTTVNITNSVSVGTNTLITSSLVRVGNATVNTMITSSAVNTDIINADVAVYVGANVNLLTTGLMVGNASVNTSINSSSIKVQSIIANGSLGIAGQFLSVNSSGGLFWEDIQPTNVFFVSKEGSDSNDGSLNRPYLTIKQALTAASNGTTIKISSGTYTETNPLTVPTNVSVIGESLRNVTVIPANTSADVFWLNNGSYVTELTIKDYVSPAAAFAFPSTGAGTITRSPYILNCTSLTTTGTGLLVDGDKSAGNRSIIAGLYTIINQGGIGVKITNRGYSQLVNIYTICADIGVLAEKGGFCTLNCSDNSFGNYGLVANGTSNSLYSGATSGTDQFGNQIVVTGLNQTPFINNVLKFSTDANYYTITGVTPLAANTSTVTLQERVSIPIANNTAVNFYQRSYIAAAGHAFEYVGTGTSLANASPFAGGITISNNQAISLSGGVVNYTSTDQFGNFNINNNLSINGLNATIDGDAFQRSLFGLMTPYILAIEGS